MQKFAADLNLRYRYDGSIFPASMVPMPLLGPPGY